MSFVNYNQHRRDKNIKRSITSKYCANYRCQEIWDELFAVIDLHNMETFFIFKHLVNHFGRVVSSNEKSFTGELGADLNWNLLNEINKENLIKVI